MQPVGHLTSIKTVRNSSKIIEVLASMKEPIAVKVFDYFIFSSLFIALCAVLMVYQADQLFDLHYENRDFMAFVFFSTVCSYNFHWYFTPDVISENKIIEDFKDKRFFHFVIRLQSACRLN